MSSPANSHARADAFFELWGILLVFVTRIQTRGIPGRRRFLAKGVAFPVDASTFERGAALRVNVQLPELCVESPGLVFCYTI